MTQRITFVCLGNICRSPMAHVVMEAKLAEAGRGDVVVTSSGTGGWHTGEPMDHRAAATLSAAGYDPSGHVARRFSVDEYAENDLILVMDEQSQADVLEQSPTVAEQAKVRLFREFDPEATEGDREVPDPWFGQNDGFATVLAMVERTCDVLVDQLAGSAR
ncbi:MAG: low molecular weight protein-tyrosine-phosphatase [Aeromicrobium sp.]|uniref:low molecular weight protein-tyrosine-phosphatase n=1 Tax=Aeromicrobium sp. TaxID=1871063 RepID=UPI0039E40131